MESEWFQQLMSWVEANPRATGWLVFFVAWAESLLLVGILLPGAAVLIGLGALIGLGVLDFKMAWLAATLGAFLGDGLSFWIGYHYKQKLLKMWPMYKFPKQVEQGQVFFSKWGSTSVFIGRFVGLVRPVIPAIAGVMNMPVRKYVMISAIASILWSPFYLLPGVLFGSAMGSMTQVAGKLALLVSIFIVAIVLIYWLIHLIYQLLLPRTHKILSRALLWTQKHPHLGRFTSGLIDPKKPETGSLGLMAVSVLFLTVISVIFLLNSATVTLWSQQLQGFIQAFNTDWTRPFLLAILALSHDLSVMLSALAVLVWLAYRKRLVAAWHWVFVVFSSWVLAVVIEMLAASSLQIRFGFHHLALFVAVMTFWAALVSGALPHRMRSWPYSLSMVLIVMVAFAQLFFHQMTLGVVLVSIFSGFIWASVVAIAYRMRLRRQFLGWHVSALFLGVMLASVIAVVYFFRGSLLNEPQIIETETISMNQWLSENHEERTDWLSREMQTFSFRYKGDLSAIKTTLQNQGWQAVEPRAWQSVWTALKVDEKSGQWPLIPKMNQGSVERLILTRPEGDSLLSLHLWSDYRRIGDSNDSLYEGYLSLNFKASEWGLKFWKFKESVGLSSAMMDALRHNGFNLEQRDETIFVENL